MVAAERDRRHTGVEDRLEAGANDLDAVVDVLRWDVEVTVVDDAQVAEGPPEAVRAAVWPHLGRPLPDSTWAEARAGAVIDAGIERYTDDRDVRARQIAADRHGHKRVDAAKANCLLPVGGVEPVVGAGHDRVEPPLLHVRLIIARRSTVVSRSITARRRRRHGRAATL